MVGLRPLPIITMKLDRLKSDNWKPKERASLVFILRGKMILLILKKRGLGAGKINGPGGRIESGETDEQGAVREVQEELGIVPLQLFKQGHLHFQFLDGHSIHAVVFTARDHQGQPKETEEAKPIWTPIDKIPFNDMWEDDRLWFPPMLQGKRFLGYFIFRKDTMLDYDIHVI